MVDRDPSIERLPLLDEQDTLFHIAIAQEGARVSSALDGQQPNPLQQEAIIDGLRSEDTIIRSNLGLVHKVAGIFYDYHDRDEIEEIALDYMRKAILKYDPKHGAKFGTYAHNRMRWGILKHLGRVNHHPEVSLNAPINDHTTTTLEEVIPDKGISPEQVIIMNEIGRIILDRYNAAGPNDKRNITMLCHYFGLCGFEPIDTNAIAALYGCTPQNVSYQVQVTARRLKYPLREYEDDAD